MSYVTSVAVLERFVPDRSSHSETEWRVFLMNLRDNPNVIANRVKPYMHSTAVEVALTTGEPASVCFDDEGAMEVVQYLRVKFAEEIRSLQPNIST